MASSLSPLLLLLVFACAHPAHTDITKGTTDGTEEWSYIGMLPGAHMFWWLYYSEEVVTSNDVSVVLWIQGSPGASGVGYGNFQEVGPLTVDLKPRSSTWLNAAHLLFVVILGQRPARLISYLYSKMPSIAPVGKWKGDLLVVKVFEGNVERGESGRFENAELGALDGLAGGLLSKIDLADAAIKPQGIEVNFIVAGCENTISGGSMRPSDILTASNGKTIEVNNTDAEGKLTLANALVYTRKLKVDSEKLQSTPKANMVRRKRNTHNLAKASVTGKSFFVSSATRLSLSSS